jgi:hypothetical protein
MSRFMTLRIWEAAVDGGSHAPDFDVPSLYDATADWNQHPSAILQTSVSGELLER